MADLQRSDVKAIVRDALRRVADFTGDIEAYTFDRFFQFHKEVFLAALKAGILGFVRGPRSSYDLDLTPDSIDDWATIGACIDDVLDKAYLRTRSTNRLTNADLGGQ
jgi:hypothetical protein